MTVAPLMATLGALAALAGRPASAGFAPGEEMVLKVRYLNIPAGEARVRVGQPEGPIWPVFFQARSGGVAGVVDVREHLVSYWDTETALPRGSDLHAYEVGDRHVDRVRFDRAAGTAIVTTERDGKRKEASYPIVPGVHEVTSAFLWLRLQPLAPGARFEIPVQSGRHAFTMLAEVLGREGVDTPAGRFEALRVRVRTGLSGNFEAKRDTVLWLSDDPRHVLVRASAEFALGTFVATLERYREGDASAAVAEGPSSGGRERGVR